MILMTLIEMFFYFKKLSHRAKAQMKKQKSNATFYMKPQTNMSERPPPPDNFQVQVRNYFWSILFIIYLNLSY